VVNVVRYGFAGSERTITVSAGQALPVKIDLSPGAIRASAADLRSLPLVEAIDSDSQEITVWIVE
jgi:hypothetical protein